MAQPLAHYTSEITVTAAGRDWHLERAADFDALWESMAADGRADADDHIPYWTELWPSSIVLSSWLALRREEIAGRTCLDLGCGLGLTALVATGLGARVLAMDYEPDALHFARRNAELNGVAQPMWTVMDWRRPAVAAGSIWRLWGGDIMYERRFVAPVLRFFDHALAPQGAAWVAEPGREVYDAFLSGLQSGGWQGRRVHVGQVDALYAQSAPVTVTVWEIRRGA